MLQNNKNLRYVNLLNNDIDFDPLISDEMFELNISFQLDHIAIWNAAHIPTWNP